MMLEKKRHEEVYRPDNLLDARQVAKVLSENSGKTILVSNVADIARRHHLTIARKVGRNNLYLYDEVRDLVINHKAGRRRIGEKPLTPAEKMQRLRARRHVSSSVSGRADVGDQEGEKLGV